jgi:hypothetical protein
MLLIKIVAGEVEANEARPGWMKVLAMEIMRGCATFSSHSLTRAHLCSLSIRTRV